MKRLLLLFILLMFTLSFNSTCASQGTTNYKPGSGINMNSTAPGNIEMSGGSVNNATLGGSVPWTIIGPYVWCDYVTDYDADEIQFHQAIADGKKNLISTGLIYISTNKSIELNETDIHLRGTAKGWQGYDQNEFIAAATTTSPVINVTATGCTVENIYIDGKGSGAVRTGAHGIRSTVPVSILDCRIYSCGENGIEFSSAGVSVGGGNPVDNCFVWNCSSWGLLTYSNDLVVRSLEVGNCSLGSISVMGHACYFGDGTHVWPTPGDEPLQSIYVTGDRNTFDGIFIDTFGWVGIYLVGAEHNSIVGCKFTDPAETGAKPIVVEASTGASHLLAVGNFLDDDAAGSVTYGIDLGNSDNNTVGFNSLGSVTGTGGSGNVIDHNNVI